MFAEFGYGILVVTFLLSLYSVGAAVFGYYSKSSSLIESARRAMLLIFPLLTVAALTLISLLMRGDFNVQFVYEVTSRSMPTYLKITAWWGGQAGSLLFWSWLMSAFASLVTLRKWDRDREFLPWVIAVTSFTLAFFIMLNVFFENPFARLYQTLDGNIAAHTFAPTAATPVVPQDGRGLNPLLRHPGMISHPPLLYLGFVSFVIPYAFAMAALITGRADDRWTRITRRWTLWAWLFLSFGLVIGGRWAYDVLGWGGYWGWDPVEISAFMPWLTGTAFLHSVMIQEKRGMLKQWNMILIILTYDLVIFGTFLTRSGVLSSVHAFAQSAIGPAFFAFIGVTFFTSIALLIHRWDDLRAEAEMKSMLSREALFLLNNLLFMSVLVVCFWGVIFPLISELATGQKVTVGPPFYERANAPIFAALMLLMGIAPLSAWGNSTLKTLGRALWKPALAALVITAAIFAFYTRNVIALIGFFLVALVILVTLYEFWRGTRARQRAQGENFFAALARLTGRNRRRYGGYIIHISMMLMAVGILGIEIFQAETQGALQTGQALELQGYKMVYKDIAQWDDASTGVNHTRAVVEIYKGNRAVAELYPRTDYFYEAQQNMTIPGLRSTMDDDVYVILVDWEPASAFGATFKLYVNPLVNWLWLGSLMFFFGIVIAAWPDREPETASVRERRSARQTSAAD
ncbi:MAG: heme lyase CcmF/NrfE family subunit [Anaerolineae bacterium CFX3]|nr:Cytochrome c-type biogenesis protein CcmF [Anaerolineales bacterium]MCE7905785.1 heme lyase CcmF/NrfE family subunit [Anaerolineae bacterium CFX3]MCQ3946947.1 heme lyase CcmF/NrfE family subunit [Anaerolineae bacterium]RIK27631.1 MAG: cytochrome C biogenesis protein [Anaerolineae bacterium]